MNHLPTLRNLRHNIEAIKGLSKGAEVYQLKTIKRMIDAEARSAAIFGFVNLLLSAEEENNEELTSLINEAIKYNDMESECIEVAITESIHEGWSDNLLKDIINILTEYSDINIDNYKVAHMFKAGKETSSELLNKARVENPEYFF